MKQDLKSSAGKKSKKPGPGGVRPGAGRPIENFEKIVRSSLHIPLSLEEGMKKAGIQNKTKYILGLIEKDLKRQGVL